MSTALSLPRPPQRDERPGPKAEAKGRILVADDERSTRRFLQRALSNHGFEVACAEDGVEALELAERDAPDLAIIDLRMPRMSGFDVVRALKTAYGSAVPVLVLSGLADPEDRVQAFDVGADDFICKPVYLPELLRRIEAFERARRAYVEVREANARTDRLRLFAAEAAALLAHDLNNGLSVAIANLQFVQHEAGLQGELHEALEATAVAQRRMAALVRNFVDISRMEDAALKPERVRVDARQLLESAAAIHAPGVSGNEVHFAIEAPAQLHAQLDPVLIERVLHNLVGNAVRYVNAGGRIALRARVNELRGELTIEVSNTGPSIPDDKRSLLFEKYGTGDQKSLRGMGLYFCRLACEAHGGSIALVEVDGFATTFAARLALV